MKNKKVPVLFCVFKRIEAIEAFEPIRQYQPGRLYIAADGPRDHVKGEKEECEKVRQMVLSKVDWPCEVKTLFREKNLGCTGAINGAISWFFEQEEYGVINEDDIVLSQDFFKMCEILLPKYKNEERIMHINSHNYKSKLLKSNEYVFSYFAKVWGWATWRRAWQKNTKVFSDWSRFPKYSLIKRYGLFQGLLTIWHYYRCANPNVDFGSWDYTWSYHIEKNNGVIISPKVHLSNNIGIGVADSSNYSENSEDFYSKGCIGEIKWPLTIWDEIKVDAEQLDIDKKDYLYIHLRTYKNKLTQWIR